MIRLPGFKPRPVKINVNLDHESNALSHSHLTRITDQMSYIFLCVPIKKEYHELFKLKVIDS